LFDAFSIQFLIVMVALVGLADSVATVQGQTVKIQFGIRYFVF